MAVFNLLDACSINLLDAGELVSKSATSKVVVELSVARLARQGVPEDPVQVFRNKLENSLMRYTGQNPQRLDGTMNRQLSLEISYRPRSDNGGPEKVFLRVLEKENGILTRFVGVCGGLENISVSLDLMFGTAVDNQMSVNFKGSNTALRIHPGGITLPVYGICKSFSMTETLAELWKTNKFMGTFTLSLILNDNALNLVYLDNLTLSVGSFTRSMLEDADSTGDACIVIGNEKEIGCHKAFLMAHSDVFKAIFQSDMKEGATSTVQLPDLTERGVRALLAYLYCLDIEMSLECSFTTWELLMVADKYNINGLLASMKDVILHKENAWFSVASAVHLWSFARKKIKIDLGFEQIFDKVVGVLRSKSQQELEQCSELKEMLSSPESAVDMCVYFMVNK